MGAGVEPEWVALNRAHWDEKVPVHLASEFYDLLAKLGAVVLWASSSPISLGPWGGDNRKVFV